jgi:hypothetical protein
MLEDIEDAATWADLLGTMLRHGFEVFPDGLRQRRDSLLALGQQAPELVERQLLEDTKAWFRRYFSDWSDTRGDGPEVRHPRPTRPTPRTTATAVDPDDGEPTVDAVCKP